MEIQISRCSGSGSRDCGLISLGRAEGKAEECVRRVRVCLCERVSASVSVSQSFGESVLAQSTVAVEAKVEDRIEKQQSFSI